MPTLTSAVQQGDAGKTQRSKHDQQHRDNLIRLRGDKQREIDRLRAELEDCQASLAVSQAKEQALTSRKKMLEKEASRPQACHCHRYCVELTLNAASAVDARAAWPRDAC